MSGNDDRVVDPPSATYLDEHVASFNEAVDTGVWEAVADRFADDGVLEFVGVPVGPFCGRAAILAAYAENPPDDTIELVGPATIEGEQLAVRYRWRRTGNAGEMRMTLRAHQIARLTVSFD